MNYQKFDNYLAYISAHFFLNQNGNFSKKNAMRFNGIPTFKKVQKFDLCFRITMCFNHTEHLYLYFPLIFLNLKQKGYLFSLPDFASIWPLW